MIVARYISGKYAVLRRGVRVGLLVSYLIVPWINWGDRPMVLLDIASRKFYFPGAVFWPQEFYFLWFVVATLGLALFLFTSLFGRMWCGWACPQTVYTEMFDAIGRVVSSRFGKASQKLWEKIAVHSVWVFVSAILTFHFIGYFVGVRVMSAEILESGPAIFTDSAWPYFWLAATGLFYFDLGIFRHNFCVYICPYARFQSVMLDRDSYVIAYDSHRGEPRRKAKKLTPEEEKQVGDCTGCTKCVQVCPTGIDIREGLQVACINCAHCVDACTDEMSRFGKETLVGFNSLNYFEERKQPRLLRPRTVAYAALLFAVIAGFTLALVERTPFQLSVVRDRDLPPLLIEAKAQNYYNIDVMNMRERPIELHLSVEPVQPGETRVSDLTEIIGENPLRLKANEHRPVRVIVQGTPGRQTESAVRQSIPVRFVLKESPASAGDSAHRANKESMFTIPK
ncbi:MAG: cytochrome c oxidase accessory protein CcoG [Leptospirales bacterium]|jgi:cytochrome c oxidase accessory protein FixG